MTARPCVRLLKILALRSIFFGRPGDEAIHPILQFLESSWIIHLGVSENSVPQLPNGFADHDPVFKWLAIIGNMNPTFSDKAIFMIYCFQP